MRGGRATLQKKKKEWISCHEGKRIFNSLEKANHFYLMKHLYIHVCAIKQFEG